SGADQWYDNNTIVQTTADATGTGPIYGTGSWTSGGAAGSSYGPGDLAYAALPATVTLNANQTYYLVTQETFGGDQWYDFDSTVQTAAVATVTSAVYGTGAPYTVVGS